MSNMFRKPKKNFRLRETAAAGSDEEHEFREKSTPMVIDLENEDSNSQPPTSSEKKEKKKKKKSEKPKSSGLASGENSKLSFGDDLEGRRLKNQSIYLKIPFRINYNGSLFLPGDDGEVFKVKKSSQSKKLRKMMQKERSKPKFGDSIRDLEVKICH